MVVDGLEERQLGAGRAQALEVGLGRTRPADKAKAWRCSLQDNTPSARRLHWWLISGKEGPTFEFANVVLHDAMSIPE